MDNTSISGSIPEPTIIDVEIEVDETLDFDQAVAAGKYDDVNSDATADQFPIASAITGKRRIKAQLVCFHPQMGDEGVDGEINKAIAAMGKKRGGTAELLALGAQHPELQRSGWIVSGAFVAPPGGFRGFLGLGSDGHERVLDLDWVGAGDEWGDNVWFFVVPVPQE